MNTIDWMRLSVEKKEATCREVTNGCITLEEIDKICMFLLDYVYINGKKPPCMDIRRINNDNNEQTIQR